MGLNQFHDILPGSAIAWVHRQARADYVRDIARLRDIAAEAGASIASARDDADMRSNAAIVPYTAKNGDSWIARTAAVGTQDDDANGTDAVADESTIATTCDDGRIILDNGLLRAIIAPDGTVRSLIDLDNGHELVPDGSGIGHYELLRDEPYEWDAWDIQRDAFLSAEGIDDSHVERVTETKRGGATVHVSSTTDGVSIDACITLRAKSKSLEFRTKVDWRASERFLKVDIPMAIQADRAQYECQYGMVERPIQKNTRSDEAKYESCTHRFVRVADAGYAAAVVNASTYGSDVSPIHRNTASGPVRGTMFDFRCCRPRYTPIRTLTRACMSSRGTLWRMPVCRLCLTRRTVSTRPCCLPCRRSIRWRSSTRWMASWCLTGSSLPMTVPEI